jgi:hypothetical protein
MVGRRTTWWYCWLEMKEFSFHFTTQKTKSKSKIFEINLKPSNKKKVQTEKRRLKIKYSNESHVKK